MKYTEESMQHIHFTPKNKFMPVMFKIFISKCLPLAIFGIIFAALDFMSATKQIVDRINDVVNFSKVLAERNYTQDNLKIVTRDEYSRFCDCNNE